MSVPMQANFGNFNPAQYQHNPDQSLGRFGERLGNTISNIPQMAMTAERFAAEQEDRAWKNEQRQNLREQLQSEEGLAQFYYDQASKLVGEFNADAVANIPTPDKFKGNLKGYIDTLGGMMESFHNSLPPPLRETFLQMSKANGDNIDAMMKGDAPEAGGGTGGAGQNRFGFNQSGIDRFYNDALTTANNNMNQYGAENFERQNRETEDKITGSLFRRDYGGDYTKSKMANPETYEDKNIVHGHEPPFSTPPTTQQSVAPTAQGQAVATPMSMTYAQAQQGVATTNPQHEMYKAEYNAAKERLANYEAKLQTLEAEIKRIQSDPNVYTKASLKSAIEERDKVQKSIDTERQYILACISKMTPEKPVDEEMRQVNLDLKKAQTNRVNRGGPGGGSNDQRIFFTEASGKFSAAKKDYMQAQAKVAQLAKENSPQLEAAKTNAKNMRANLVSAIKKVSAEDPNNNWNESYATTIEGLIDDYISEATEDIIRRRSSPKAHFSEEQIGFDLKSKAIRIANEFDFDKETEKGRYLVRNIVTRLDKKKDYLVKTIEAARKR